MSGCHNVALFLDGALATPVISLSLSGSPRVFAARSAISAAPSTKMLPVSSARWNPDESATTRVAWDASSELVRDVASADRIASQAPPPPGWTR